MVPHGVSADVELGRDLLGRMPTLEQPQDLVLSRRKPRDLLGRRVVGHVGELTEDPDDKPTAPERDRADLDVDAAPVRVRRVAGVSVTSTVPRTFCVKSSRARRVCSRATTEV